MYPVAVLAGNEKLVARPGRGQRMLCHAWRFQQELQGGYFRGFHGHCHWML